MKKLIISGLIALFVSMPVSAKITKIQGSVLDVWFAAKDRTVYNDNSTGIALIHIDSPNLLAACGSNKKRIAISTNHPLYKSLISALLNAKTTGGKIEIWHLDTCSVKDNSWDFSLLKLL